MPSGKTSLSLVRFRRKVKKVDYLPKVDMHMSRADELIKNDKIVFSPKLGTFTTKGTDDQPRVVTIFPEKCSCPLKSCYHILAVKKISWYGNQTENDTKHASFKRCRQETESR